MFMALFDVLPVHIRDWIDTSTIVTSLFGDTGTDSGVWHTLLAISPDGQYIQPEGIMNINFGLIMLTCFLIAGLAARLGTLNSLIIGTLLCSGGLFIIGGVNAAWFIVLAIVTFSIGEMLASPTSSKLIGNIAPDDKKAMYLGFKDLPLGIGWVAESFVGPTLYDKYAAKETLARELLQQEYAFSAQQIANIAQGEYFSALVKVSDKSASVLTQQLYDANNIGLVWFVMALEGVASAIGLVSYAKWLISARSSLTKAQIAAID